MQFVPGISSGQTMPAAPAPAAAGRKPSLWILDSWRDLVLYVCTPLLLVPMFIAAQGFWSADTFISSSLPLAQWATTCRE